MSNKFSYNCQKHLRQRVHNVRNLAGLLLGCINVNDAAGFFEYHAAIRKEVAEIGDEYQRDMMPAESTEEATDNG